MSSFYLPALNYFFFFFSRGGGVKQPLLLLRPPLSSFHFLLEEYQVYLAGVFESNPLKLRNCISFHQIEFAFTEGVLK